MTKAITMKLCGNNLKPVNHVNCFALIRFDDYTNNACRIHD